MTATVLRRARQGKKPPPQVEICIGGFKMFKISFEKILLHQTIENVIDNPSPVKVHLAISLERPQGKIQIDKGKNINKDENINNHHQTTTAYRLRGRLARLDTETALERMMMGASIY